VRRGIVAEAAALRSPRLAQGDAAQHDLAWQLWARVACRCDAWRLQ